MIKAEVVSVTDKKVTLLLDESSHFKVGYRVFLSSIFKRSKDQNKMYWQYLTWALKVCPRLKVVFNNKDTLHFTLKSRFLGIEMFEENETWVFQGSTASLTPGMFSQYLSQIDCWFQDNYAIDTSVFWSNNPKATLLPSKHLRLLQGLCYRYADGHNEPKVNVIKNFIAMFCRQQDLPLFTLADLDGATYTRFNSWLVGQAMEYNFTTDQPWKLMNDKNMLCVYSIKLKVCAICGKKKDDGVKVEIHHLDTVGGHATRKTDDGLRIIALCATHHKEAHGDGVNDFMRRYNLEDITWTKKDIEKLLGSLK